MDWLTDTLFLTKERGFFQIRGGMVCEAQLTDYEPFYTVCRKRHI